MNEFSLMNEAHKRINRRLLYTFIITLISIQAFGFLLLLHNLNVYSAILSAVVLGFLVPLLLGSIFMILAKKMEKGIEAI